MSDKNSLRLGKERISSLVFSMSVPVMLSMAVLALYNVVDSIFIARYNEESLSALSIVFPIQQLHSAISVGTAIGIGSLLSRSLGEGNLKKSNLIALNSFFLSILVSIPFIIFAVFAAPMFARNFTNSERIYNDIVSYVRVVMCLNTPVSISIVVERLMQSEGDSLHPMLVQIIGAVVNIILDPLLIFGIGFFPELGITGAGIATVLGQVVGVTVAYCFFRKSKVITARFSDLKGFRPDKGIIKEIYVVGVPSIILQGLNSITVMSINLILKGFTELATAAFGIFFKVNSFLYMPIFGLNSGLIPIVGYNYGAKNRDRVFKAVKTGVIIAGSIMLVGTLVFQFLYDIILIPFDPSPELRVIIIDIFKYVSIGLVPSAIAIALNSFFMGIGAGVSAMIVNLVRQLVGLIPLIIILSKIIGMTGVWMAYPIAELLALAAALLLYIIKKRSIRWE